MVAQTAIFRDLRGSEKVLKFLPNLAFYEEKDNNVMFLETCREVAAAYRDFQKR